MILSYFACEWHCMYSVILLCAVQYFCLWNFNSHIHLKSLKLTRIRLLKKKIDSCYYVFVWSHCHYHIVECYGAIWKANGEKCFSVFIVGCLNFFFPVLPWGYNCHFPWGNKCLSLYAFFTCDSEFQKQYIERTWIEETEVFKV